MDHDVINYAGQIGRLDLVSLLLTAIGLILVAGGVFAFFNFRSLAKRHARETAEIISRGIAEKVANEYMAQNLPEIVSAWSALMKDMDRTSPDVPVDKNENK